MSGAVEYEGRILDIDVDKISKKILEIGGTHVGDVEYRRYIFDTQPAKKDTWLRLRTDGGYTTLALKEISADTIDGTHEWEVEVENFDTMREILNKCGLQHRNYQENRRSLFKLGDIEISIDSWPKIPPYLEIEAGSLEAVEETALKMGFSKEEISGLNTSKIYDGYGFDISQITDLRFD